MVQICVILQLYMKCLGRPQRILPLEKIIEGKNMVFRRYAHVQELSYLQYLNFFFFKHMV